MGTCRLEDERSRAESMRGAFRRKIRSTLAGIRDLLGLTELQQQVTDLQHQLISLQNGFQASSFDHSGPRRLLNESSATSQAVQMLLHREYRVLLNNRLPPPELTDTEFRCFSQNGEDGILLYIFSILGTTNRRVVEISAGDGIECNSANLIINHGWHGLSV